MNNEKIVKKQPLFHIVKRANITLKQSILLKGGSIVFAILLCSVICGIIFKGNPFEVIVEIFNGNFGTERRMKYMLRESALLLCVGLALLPAFKMKFWNLGANGQILIGGLACASCMFYFGGKMSDWAIYPMMIVSSIVAGAVWAVIPAIFKAFFNTNESLFTLMMNYIATGILAYFLSVWVKSGSGVLYPMQHANLPQIVDEYFPTIVISIILTFLMFVYMKFSKHGFEVGIVGENVNTAKYVGINVKKVVIRTLALSGAICGLVGLIIVGGINYTISESSANNMGFTAIMVTWLAKFNPIMMVLSSFFIIFMTRGMARVQTHFGITNNAVCDIVIGIVYFVVIAFEFFISYKIMFNDDVNKFFAKICAKVKSVFNFKGKKSSQSNEKESER